MAPRSYFGAQPCLRGGGAGIIGRSTVAVVAGGKKMKKSEVNVAACAPAIPLSILLN